jgi:membrane-bound lytic murein transglycosylase
MANQFELADVLKHVAAQLGAADKAAKDGGNPVMQFEECEVEFAVKVEAAGKAGVKVWVMEFGAEAKREQSNKVKIKFKAIPGKSVQASQVAPTEAAEPIKRQPTTKRSS